MVTHSDRRLELTTTGTLSKLNEPPKSQSELTAEFWPEIVLRRYEFELTMKKTASLGNLKLEALRGFSDNFLLNPASRKRLR